MKKIIILIFVILSPSLLFAAPPDGTGGWDDQSRVTEAQKPVKQKVYTVATLPTGLSAGDAGATVWINDGDGTTDCTSGTGSDWVQCRWTGSAWANAGDGTAEGSAEVQDEVFNSTNFNGDTAHGVSQDDFYDLWHGIDADDDGSFADETWLTAYLTEAELTTTLGAAYDTEAELDALFAAKEDSITTGIADTNVVVIDQGANAADDELARFTASGIEGLSYAELAAVAGFETALEGVLDIADLQGNITDAKVPNDITIDTATLATNFTVSANNSTDETIYPVFVDGATGTQGAETDTGFTYNPSTGELVAALFDGELDGEDLDIANTTAETTIAADDLVIIYDTSATANRAMTRGNFVTGIGAGQAITLDIEDDGGNDSVDLGEIATDNDTNGIFTEPSADKLLIDLSKDWPKADVADTVTIADNESTDETNAILFTPGGDLDGGNLTPESDGDLTYNPSSGTLAATEFSGGGSGLTDVDAATGDDAGSFFDSGVLEHERGGLEANVSAYAGLVAISGGSTSNITDGAGLETILSLGAYASDILACADSDALVTALGLVAGDIPDLSGTYEVQLTNEAGLYGVLSDVTDFTQPGENETITGNWVNTTNPWADNEVSDTITVGASGSVNIAALPYGTQYQLLQTNEGATAAEWTSSPSFSELNLPSSDADPSTTNGQIKHDSTVTGMSGGALRWYESTLGSRMVVDLDTDPSNDDYVVSYDADNDKFYMKADADSLDATPDGMDDGEYNGVTIEGINHGETVGALKCVFLAADGKVDIADADAAGEFPAFGLTVNGGDDTDAAIILVRGIVRDEDWTGLTPGGAVYLGDAGAGQITQTPPSTSGDCVQIVGWALSDSEIYFDFSRPYQEVE